MKRYFLSIALLIAIITICSGQENITWDKWEWLIGEWLGEGSGQPGQGGGTFSFSFSLDDKVLIRKSHSEYPAEENKPEIIHDDLMIVYRDFNNDLVKAVYFDNEGHTIFYTASFGEKQIILTSDKIPDFPVFRLIYTLLEKDTVYTQFEISENGQEFMPYIEGKSMRIKCEPESPLAYSQLLHSAELNGKILNATEKKLKIGDTDVPVSEKGDFIFRTDIEFPCFVDINYANLSWAIYLEPGKTVELKIKSTDLSGLIYKGHLKNPNEYLKKIIPRNKEVNEFLVNNWYPIHAKNESEFISIIDSLKDIFLDPLADYQKKHKHSPDNFTKLLEADVNYSLNSLIFQYPEIHSKLTGYNATLSQEGIAYINSVPVDEIRFIDLQSYKSYCKKWIDYNADVLISKNSEQKHYNLKKMDILFEFLPGVFKNQRLEDYWLSEYLNEHIENAWLSNSDKYVEAFNKTCKTEVYKDKINDLYNSYSDLEKDHVMKIYKSVNGFNLEANIFYPESLKKDEKRPAMVIFHGGGFVLGNPSWAFGKARNYAEKGMIAVSAQYRLSNFRDISPLDAIQDAKDLMKWLRKNADSLRIINDKVAVSGWSVGGQLCATLAVFVDTLPDSKINTSPNALLLTSPGTGTGGWFTELLNGADVNPADFSPADHIRKGLPPTIILQGRDDTVTPLKDVQLFHDRMVSYDNYCEMWIYDDVGHLFTPTSLGDNGWPKPDPDVQKQADLRAEEFLRKFGFLK